MMSAPPLKRPHILVVDDSAGVRANLERLLSPYCQVTLAEGVQEAMAALHPQMDLVLSDIQMPDESGLDLARSLRQSHPDLPVVLATGVIEPTIKTEAHGLGIQDVLRKPLTPENLFPVLEKHLRQKLSPDEDLAEEPPPGETAQLETAGVQIQSVAPPPQAVPEVIQPDLLGELGALPGVLSAALFGQDGACLRLVNLPFPAAMGQALSHLMDGAVSCQHQLGTRLNSLSQGVQVEFVDRILVITPYQGGHLAALVRDVTAAIAVKGFLRNTALNAPEA